MRAFARHPLMLVAILYIGLKTADPLGRPAPHRLLRGHEAGQAHEGDVALLQFSNQDAIVVLARRKTSMAQDQRFETGGCCMGQPRRIGTIRNHDGNRRIKAAIGDGVDDGLQVGTAPRNQDAQPSIRWHGRVRRTGRPGRRR